MEKIKSNIGLILYLIIVFILTIIMFWEIGRKEGFHEDEMFSYGASNSTLGNTFISYGRIDNIDTIIKTRNPFLTLKNYLEEKTNRKFTDEEFLNCIKNLENNIAKNGIKLSEEQLQNIGGGMSGGEIGCAALLGALGTFCVGHYPALLTWACYSGVNGKEGYKSKIKELDDKAKARQKEKDNELFELEKIKAGATYIDINSRKYTNY